MCHSLSFNLNFSPLKKLKLFIPLKWNTYRLHIHSATHSFGFLRYAMTLHFQQQHDYITQKYAADAAVVTFKPGHTKSLGRTANQEKIRSGK